MDKLDLSDNQRLLDQSSTLLLGAHPTSPSAAREFVASALEDWGRTDNVATAVLLTSELVTNAVLHAESDIAVTVQEGEWLRIEVFDEKPDQLSQHQLGRGRGLRLVDALAAGWGVRAEGRGKAVWFELAH
jgi:anti-sigma regulatory factor (Ser/Thr protein kinase)